MRDVDSAKHLWFDAAMNTETGVIMNSEDLKDIMRAANESAQSSYKAGYDQGYLDGLKFAAATLHDAKLGVDKRPMVDGPRPDECGPKWDES